MDPSLLIAIINQGSILIPKLIEMKRKGQTVSTPEDVAELIAYGKINGADYLTEIGLRIDEAGDIVPL